MDLTASLHELFGFRDFRPGQREACEAALEGRDVLVVMPTGLGQVALLPAAGAPARRPHGGGVAARGAHAGPGGGAAGARPRRPGGARQRPAGRRRERRSARARGCRAICGSSTWRPSASRRRASWSGWRDAASGCSWSTRRTASPSGGTTSGPTTSAWPTPRAQLGAGAIVASTATATPRVAADIVRRLGLRDPLRVATGFDRPNIAFAVARPAPHEKRALLARARCAREDALPAIVYAGTRAGAEEIGGRAQPRRWAWRPWPTTPGSSASAAPTSSAASSPTTSR